MVDGGAIIKSVFVLAIVLTVNILSKESFKFIYKDRRVINV